MGLWWYATRQQDWRMVLAIIAVLLAGAAARTSWTRIPAGQLAWNGDIWRWESAGYQAGIAEHEVSVVADFQRILLLRLENQAHASMWLWLEQSVLPERWLDLRRAVYSPHKKPSARLPHDAASAGISPLPSSIAAGSMTKSPVNVSRANP